jgi:hypothetical protein
MAGFASLRHATISGAFALQVQAEQANDDMMQTPVMQAILGQIPRWQAAITMGNGSASRLSLLPLRDAVMAATAEGTDPGATAFVPTNRDLATARQAILFELGDDEVNRIPPGLAAVVPALNMDLSSQPTRQEMEALMTLGMLGYFAFVNRVAALVKALASSWGTYSFGTTGTNYDFAKVSGGVDDLVDAGNRGKALWLTTRAGWNQYRTDVLSKAGAIQYHAVAQRTVDPGASTVISDVYAGVDAAIVTGLPTGGGDTYDSLFFAEGVTVKVETPTLQAGAELIGTVGPANAPLVTIERRRDAGSVSKLSVVSWLGVGIADDNAGSKGIRLT